MSGSTRLGNPGIQERLKRRRIDTESFPPVHDNPSKLASEECGACLLPLVDTTEAGFRPEDDVIVIAQPDTCAHLFHHNCMRLWSRRDTSCPLCRLRFGSVGMYRTNGHLVETKRVEPVFLSDVLEREEEDEDWDEYQSDDSPTDVELPEAPIRRPAQRVESGTTGRSRYDGIEAELRRRRQVRDDARAEDAQGSTQAGRARRRRRQIDPVEQVIEGRIAGELARMREQLAAERRRELAEAERIRDRIDTEMVKLQVLRNLKRLPYHFSGVAPLNVSRSQPAQSVASHLSDYPLNTPAGSEPPKGPVVSVTPCPNQHNMRYSQPEITPMAPHRGRGFSPAASPESAHMSTIPVADTNKQQRMVVPTASAAAKSNFGAQFARLRRAPQYQQDFIVKPTLTSSTAEHSPHNERTPAD